MVIIILLPMNIEHVSDDVNSIDGDGGDEGKDEEDNRGGNDRSDDGNGTCGNGNGVNLVMVIKAVIMMKVVMSMLQIDMVTRKRNEGDDDG